MKSAELLTISVVILPLIFCFAVVSKAAQVGTAFTYQGHLYDANYAANGLYDFAFKLYDANVGGSKAGTEVNAADVDVIDAYFTVELDFNDVNAFNGDARWLEIGIRPGDLDDPNIYTILSPRQEVTPAPYALHALTAGSGSGSLWQVSDSNIYYNNGKVGIGTTDTGGYMLKVQGAPGIWSTGQIWCNGRIGTTNPTDGMQAPVFKDRDNINYYLDPSNTGNSLLTAGNVGIGTTSPSVKLDVAGGINASEYYYINDNVLVYNPSASGSFIYGWDVAVQRQSMATDGVERLVIDDSGRVGIGTTSPMEALEVNGTVKATSFVGDGSGLTNLSADSDWAISDSNMYSAVSGNVGIGTTTPAAKLTVNGSILRDGSTMRGANADTHINLGMYSYTGITGQNYSYVTVGGGYSNLAGTDYATVGGGCSNSAEADYTTVGGGWDNTASDAYATVGGGWSNTASDSRATVGGGWSNLASGKYATIAGGCDNAASGNDAAVGGGAYNFVNGYAGTVPGGYDNKAGNYSFAAGCRAKAIHSGCFVWADSGMIDFESTDANQFLIDADGGVCIGDTSPDGTFEVNPDGTEDNGDEFVIADSGYVGIGTTSPEAPLHVAGGNWDLTNTEGDLKIGDNSYRLKIGIAKGGGGAGTAGIRSHGGLGNLILGSNSTEVLIVQDTSGGRVGIGTMSPNGTLDVNGSIYQRGSQLHADYVFGPDYKLESIEEHSKFMYTNKHLKAIPQVSVDENGAEIVEVGSHRKGIVEELEKAHIYIEQLNKRIGVLEKENEDIKSQLGAVESLVEKLAKERS